MQQLVWETAEELDQKLAQRVRNIRKRRSISQEKLASMSGVSYGSIKRFETTGMISLLSLTKIAMALDMADELRDIFTSMPYRDIQEVINETRSQLLHDASECYMSDVPRPLKQFMTVYKEQENHLLDVLYTKFLGSPLDEQEEKTIKEIDDAVLWYDMKYLLGEDSEGDKPETCMVPDYTVRAFKDVEQEYLEIFEKYKVL